MRGRSISRRFLVLFAASLATLPSMRARALADIEYARAGSESLLLDGFLPDSGPDGKKLAPAVILVHGGAWVTGDKRRNVAPLFQPLSDAGYAWFTINYRLARGDDPASLISISTLQSLGAAIDDVRSAVAFIRAHAAEYSIDPNRIVLVGESAGAHLISMAALKPNPGQEVLGAIAFYSPSDLWSLVEKSDRIPEALRRAVKGTIIELSLRKGLLELSPQTWVRADAPAFLMIHGTADPLVPVQQSRDMCAALVKATARCDLYLVDGGAHGMNGWELRGLTSYRTIMMQWLADLFHDRPLVREGP